MRPIDETGNLHRSALDRANDTLPNKKTEAEKSENKPLTAPNSGAAISNHKFYGQRQKERLNAELIAYGVGGNSAYRDARLPTITKNANAAYRETFDKDFKKFADYSRALETIKDSKTPAKVKTSLEAAARRYDGAKSYPEVAQRAENAYRAELRRAGFNAADVRGASVYKAADFLMSPSNPAWSTAGFRRMTKSALTGAAKFRLRGQSAQRRAKLNL